MGKKSRSSSFLSCCFYCGPALQIIIFAVIPLLLATLLMLAGVRWISVYTYTAGGTTYHIGAASYSIGGDHLKPKWLYDTPSAWPSPVSRIPVLLLLHFVLALVLAFFLLFLLWRYMSTRNSEVIRIPPRWLGFVEVLLGLLVFMLAWGDAIVWIIARNRGQDLAPTALGYIVIIFGILLSAIWILTVPAAYSYRWPTVAVQYVDRKTKQKYTVDEPRQPSGWNRLFRRTV